MQHDQAIVVAGHICLDIHVDIGPDAPPPAELIVPGKLIEVGPAHLANGGSVANTGVALHRLGLQVRLVGKVGADALGQTTLGVLREQAAHLADGMIVSPQDQSSYTVVVNPPGVDRAFLHCPGANHTFASSDVTDAHLDGAGWLHFGYPPLMRRAFEHDGREVAALFARARERGIVTSLDMAMPDPDAPPGKVDWRTWLTNVLPMVDVFAPSIDEISYMLQVDEPMDRESGQYSTEALRTIAETLLNFGAAIVALKLGEQGLCLRASADSSRFERLAARCAIERTEWQNAAVLQPCYEVDVAGTTGAGDATFAGLIAALCHGLGPADAAQRAVGVGACSVEAADAVSGVPSWGEVGRRIESGWKVRGG